MFGFKKKRVEMRTVEDFVKNEDTGMPGDVRIPGRESASSKIKPIIAPLIGFLVILVLLIAAFAKIATLTAEVGELKSQSKAGEIDALRSQVSILATQIEKNSKVTEQLRADITKLEHDFETVKAQKARAETAAAAKKPAVADKKKKPAGRR